MGEQRLSNIAILSIERETTNFVEENMMDIIIDEFAWKNDDRARLLCHKWSSVSLDPIKNFLYWLFMQYLVKIYVTFKTRLSFTDMH